MILASPIQTEAFAWWLSREKMRDRTAAALQARFGVSQRQSERWRQEFGERLAKLAGEVVDTQLRQYREEYETIQTRTMAAIPRLLDAVEANSRLLETMASEGGAVDPGLIRETTSALGALYKLAEAASGADTAKKIAVKRASPGDGSAGRSLPDYGGLAGPDDRASALAIEVEAVDLSPGSTSITDPDTESPSGSGESPGK